MEENNVTMNEVTTEDVIVDEVVDQSETVEETNPPVAIENEDDPLTKESMANIKETMKQVKEMVGIMEQNWSASKQEFNLTDAQMRELFEYNDKHRYNLTEDATEEEKSSYDRFNGIDNITEEDVIGIFGEEHDIIGFDHEMTVGRLKDCINDFYSWLEVLSEYRQISNAYTKLIELEEEANIEKLKMVMENETDETKKAVMQNSIDGYYNKKYLNFLPADLTDERIDIIVNAFKDGKKLEYWLTRCRDKLDQLKVPQKFILEISQFEKRFLDEKYHDQNNILLTYFMNLVVFSDMTNKANPDMTNALAMVVGLDMYVRKVHSEETQNKITENLIAFEEKFYSKMHQ